MLRLVCDKCNKILSPTDDISTFYTNGSGSEIRYDFCEKCYKSFINWFNNKENLDETTD